MKYFITLALIITSTLVCAKNVKIKAQIVLSSNDTLHGFILSERNFVFADVLVESSFNKEIQFFNNDGVANKYKFIEIKSLIIIDLQNKTREFVQKEGYVRLLEKMYLGKVSFYKEYYWNSGNSTQDISLEIYNEKGKKYSIGVFSSKRGKLKKFAVGKPKTLLYIKNNKMTDKNIIEVLRLYESEIS